jgi:hypothetical protein
MALAGPLRSRVSHPRPKVFVAALVSVIGTCATCLLALGVLVPLTVGADHDHAKVSFNNPITWVGPSPLLPSTATGGKSSNWAGYADTGKEQSFTDVKGSWIEPTISCSSSLSSQNDDAFWVGLDGLATTSQTVEQTGTEGICEGSTTHYDAWYEMFPKSAVVAFTIQAGDQITAEVASDGTKRFTLTLTDVTSGKHFQETLKSASALRSSAEWIVETSSACNNCLENFGTLTFSGASATESGTTGGISSFKNAAITMVSPSDKVMAQPSALGDGGSSFTVTWKRA